MGSSPTRGSSFFLGKVTALGVLCCFALFVGSTLLASLSSLIKTCNYSVLRLGDIGHVILPKMAGNTILFG